jgi:hypothetical protein
MLSSDERGEYDRPGGLESRTENGLSRMNPFRFGERGVIVRGEVQTSEDGGSVKRRNERGIVWRIRRFEYQRAIY